MTREAPTDSGQTATARRALEDVCSGRHLEQIPDVYHPEFVDHVNALEYRGHDGARRSVARYLELFPDPLTCLDRSAGRRRDAGPAPGARQARAVTERLIAAARRLLEAAVAMIDTGCYG